jgi:hypothetical protein
MNSLGGKYIPSALVRQQERHKTYVLLHWLLDDTATSLGHRGPAQVASADIDTTAARHPRSDFPSPRPSIGKP